LGEAQRIASLRESMIFNYPAKSNFKEMSILIGPTFKLLIDTMIPPVDLTLLKKSDNYIPSNPKNIEAQSAALRAGISQQYLDKYFFCKNCNKENSKFNCGKCGESYCSKECQVNHFQVHKKHCVCNPP
jgi:hypothetical protein